jgi:hypothetical protein
MGLTFGQDFEGAAGRSTGGLGPSSDVIPFDLPSTLVRPASTTGKRGVCAGGQADGLGLGVTMIEGHLQGSGGHGFRAIEIEVIIVPTIT